MKLYLIEDSASALACRQLIKLGAECARLHWSNTITDVPRDVMTALSTIEEYVEIETRKLCGDGLPYAELDEDTEAYLHALFKESSFLKEIVGSGVVMAGNQAEAVLKEMKGDSKLVALTNALSTKKSVAIL